MKFFWQKDNLPKPSIDDNYKYWIDNNIHWLISLLSRPSRRALQYDLNQEYFPRTFAAGEISPLGLVGDIGSLLLIPENRIRFQWIDKLQEVSALDLKEKGGFESWVKVTLGEDGFPIYEIYLASDLQEKPGRILFCIIYECLCIVMSRTKGWEEAHIDNPLFLYLMGTYLGLGLIMSHHLEQSEIGSDGLWTQNWVYTSPMPSEAFAYSLALVAQVLEDSQPTWIKELPPNLLTEFKICQSYLNKHPTSYTRKTYSLPEEKLWHLLQKASNLYADKKFQSALETAYQALSFVRSTKEIAYVYNSIGYYKSRLGLFESAIPDFARAQKEDPSMAYAFDNMGFAYIRMGDTEAGKKYIDKAISLKTNHSGYSNRNLAIYYQEIGDEAKAEECFLAALAPNLEVDLLYYLYGEFLWSVNRVEKAKYCFEVSAKLGEPESIAALAKYFPPEEE